ncbi:hypothetical protein M8J77_002950 [Diaphorina citri]|nr:hypothetical protein M8J77_002950 [Diaphorina citri]
MIANIRTGWASEEDKKKNTLEYRTLKLKCPHIVDTRRSARMPSLSTLNAPVEPVLNGMDHRSCAWLASHLWIYGFYGLNQLMWQISWDYQLQRGIDPFDLGNCYYNNNMVGIRMSHHLSNHWLFPVPTQAG